MISYINGLITHKSPVFIVVEAGGIGYHVNISLNTFAKIEDLAAIKIFTHLIVKEDSHTLYGFAEEGERQIFIQLISISGVGPNTARLVISSMTVDEIKAAIVHENVAAFNKVKGVGPKTAKQIILDLKDKISKEVIDQPLTTSLLHAENKIREEALSALVALGFVRINVQRSLNAIMKEQPNIATVEELIKVALKKMSA
jgi:Holliday junction DNA helicase RuvA